MNAPGNERDESSPAAAPTELRVSSLRVGADDLIVMSYPKPARDLPSDFTSAEEQVFSMLQAGLSTAEIAAARDTSRRTVANQIASIFRKTGVNSRAELFCWWTGGGDAR